jgi:acyl-CoA synthetase (AMP-forming)/AMP-acid ligase II
MEVPLTPLEFARRTRRLHGHREGVVDGGLRLTYEQFFDRCDRWSAALQGLGVAPGDRVATIAPNTHAQLESFYAVPQIGAVLVPINYRLTADDFVYIINHSGSSVVCAHSDYLEVLDAAATRCRACGTSWPTRAHPGTAGATTRRRSPAPHRTSPGRRSASGTCSPSTTPAAPPPGPRAS